MPRLTTQQYLTAHTWLRTLWLTDTGRYADLTATEQWYLHGYFAPSERRTKLELLAHRREITRTNPSLPQCAGRALAKLRVSHAAVLIMAPEPLTGRSRRMAVTHVEVRSVVLPQLDISCLARALLLYAKHLEASKPRQR